MAGKAQEDFLEHRRRRLLVRLGGVGSWSRSLVGERGSRGRGKLDVD